MKKDALSAVVFAAILAALLVIGATAAFAVDITGHWKGSNGVEYDITQVGTAFNWKVPATGEIGVGTINGKDCSAGWPFGFATGMIVTNPSGAAVEISWSNGVVFRRPAPGGGTGTGTGPGTGTGTAPGGGTTSELQYNFGPNPAWAGATLWVKLSQPIAHDIKVWHNGQVLPITKYVDNNTVEITLPMKVTSGPLKVEYQGKRIVANQPNTNLDIKSLDMTGNWVWEDSSCTHHGHIVQNGNKLTWYIEDGPCKGQGGMPTLVFSGMTLEGTIKDGNKLSFTCKGCTFNWPGDITGIDKNGRATLFKLNDGTYSGTTRRP